MTLTWDGLFHPTASFGILSTRLVEELLSLGVDVRVDPWPESKPPYSDAIRAAMMGKREGPCIRVSHPNGAVPGTIPFIFFEDSELTAATDDLERTINVLRTFPVVLVSSQYNADILTAYGVRNAIVPLGSDITPFPYVYVVHDGPYTFLCVAEVSRRKGSDLLVRAFNEISPGKNMRLILKSVGAPTRELGNVRWIGEPYSVPELELLYSECDCFVLPTRGEGFCMPALDAAKAGLPVIVTGWGGQTDFCDSALHIRYEIARRDDGSSGLWAEPDLEHLKELMIACYEQRPRPAPLQGWTWREAAQTLLDTLRGAELL